ncbi:alpha/beta hydrolase [Rheinheimera baltica]|uniref:alpha/beta hydrolase n=1 Tax=Rheinheimera baltica TaxID=67576 RepID=UPI00273D2046|nr:alpha/beta hydrolase-fold protein [Rheinheimera baltica]MDP5148862.1 alpha/beta hydrolase-fold protein [Rheinheimera baltica]
MKKITVNLILVMMCFFHFSVFAAEKFGKIEQTTIQSEILTETRELVVYLPADYEDSTQPFPVLYITDGDIQGPHTAATLDYLSKFDVAPSMIVVGIVNPRHKRAEDLTLTKDSSEQPEHLAGADRFLSYIEQEVIPFIKSRYRTSAYQALSGTSHGGQFAVNALIKRPNLFNGVIAISPSLYWNNKQLLNLAEEALKNQALKGRLFMSIANEEPTMTEPFQQLVELTNKYPSKNLNVLVKTFSDESHNSTTLLGQYYGLKHLFPNWAIPETPQTLADLQAVFKARSALLNQTLVIPEDRAAGYGQWLQYLNRQEDALALLKWNIKTYPQSLNAHSALIKAYLHFNLPDAAKAALEAALKSVSGLSTEQKEQLEGLFT